MINKEDILSALREIEDPDLHKDIVTLGFIQNLDVTGDRVQFDINLTTPACPVKDQIKSEAEARVKKITRRERC